MVTEPIFTVSPTTIPVAWPIVAMVVSPELHAPPVFASLNVIKNPPQTLFGPVIAAGV